MYNGDFALTSDQYLKLDGEKQYYDNIFIKTSEDPETVDVQFRN